MYLTTRLALFGDSTANSDLLTQFMACLLGEWQKKGLASGWAELGYTNDWRKPPSEDENFKIRRARVVKHLQQCGKYMILLAVTVW